MLRGMDAPVARILEENRQDPAAIGDKLDRFADALERQVVSQELLRDEIRRVIEEIRVFARALRGERPVKMSKTK